MRHLNAAEHLSSLFLALGSLASCARSARRPFTHRRDLPWCLHPLTTVPLLHQLILPIQFTHHRALLVNSFTPFSFTPHATSPRLIHPSLSTQLLLVLIRGSFFHFHSLINHNLFRIAYSHSIIFSLTIFSPWSIVALSFPGIMSLAPQACSGIIQTRQKIAKSILIVATHTAYICLPQMGQLRATL